MMWLFVTVLSLAVGGAVGFALMWVWFFVRVIFLGYGDSGPSWINTVSDLVIIAGCVLSVIGGQWIYFRKVRQQAGLPVTTPPR